MSIAPPPKKPPPAPPSRPSVNNAPSPKRDFQVEQGVVAAAQRVTIYGTAKIGKSSLCALLSEVGVKPLVIDAGDGTKHLNVARLQPQNWQEIRDILHDGQLWSAYGAVVIDDLTAAQDMAIAHTLATIKHDKGHFVTRLEGYGYGKGYSYVYETFLQLLGDLDQHVRAGRHVVCVAHEECTKAAAIEEYLRYDMRLQATDKGNIRKRVTEWTDHLVFIDYDIAINEQGKAIGAGTRTIYVQQRPTCVAGSRTLSENVVYEKGDATFWKQLLNKE